MATLGTINDAEVHDKAHQGDRMLAFPFSDVNDADTWDSGIDSITRVAWEPTDSGDQVAVTHSGATVTFSTSGGATAHAGNLLVWARGY